MVTKMKRKGEIQTKEWLGFNREWKGVRCGENDDESQTSKMVTRRASF